MSADDDDFEKLLASGHNLDSIIPRDLSGKDKIEHATDAIDYESEGELAEEEDVEPASDLASDAGDGVDADSDGGFSEPNDWTDAFAAELGLVAEPEEDVAAAQLRQLRVFWPGFKPHTILKMNELFGPQPSTSTQPAPPRVFRAVVPQRPRLDVDTDQRAVFEGISRGAPHQGPVVVQLRPDLDKAELLGSAESVKASDAKEESDPGLSYDDEELALEVVDWDSILDPPSPQKHPPPKKPRLVSADVFSEIYDSDIEEKLLKGTLELAPSRPQVDMNDPNLLFIEDRTPKNVSLEPRYNISNDRAYDMLRENYQKKVRSTIGSLTIDHSLVALRLQSPFYKVYLTKSQMRAWHRPRFVARPGTQVNFSPLRQRKKRKDKHKTIQQLLAHSGDLTLGDSAPLFLIEYSEEFPLVLNNTGMGSKLINYYRKRTADDTSRPKLPLGETHVLDVQDRSAFWNFGFVEPGNVVPTLYSQMMRAPIFRHEPKRNDFLVIRSSVSSSRGRSQRWFLRPVPYLFVAGQELPVTVVPGPHSRKVTAASKNRLKMIVYRILNKNPMHQLQVKDILENFPGQNIMQNRQRLKEFMEYHRQGEAGGHWRLKDGDLLLTEDQIRQMITPEDVALLESMQMGQQRLEDAGFATTQTSESADDDGQSLEERLAPWNLSRNFVNAVQGKAMLQLTGEGDPSARNEGFSFLRTSMKGGFKGGDQQIDALKLGGHSYNVALQQKAYDEEIRRIWYAQARALRISDPAKLPATDHSRERQSRARKDQRKVLQITRMVRDSNGILQRKVQLVTDPNVIRAYLKRRQVIDEAKMAVDDITVTDNAEANEQKRKFLEAEFARLSRNHDRRLARKAIKDATEGGNKKTTRKCATCGAIGHIKTNKACPMFNDIYLGGQPK